MTDCILCPVWGLSGAAGRRLALSDFSLAAVRWLQIHQITAKTGSIFTLQVAAAACPSEWIGGVPSAYQGYCSVYYSPRPDQSGEAVLLRPATTSYSPVPVLGTPNETPCVPCGLAGSARRPAALQRLTERQSPTPLDSQETPTSPGTERLSTYADPASMMVSRHF